VLPRAAVIAALLLLLLAAAACAPRATSGLTLLPLDRPADAFVASARARLAEGRRLRALSGRGAARPLLDAALFDAERALSAANPLVAERLVFRHRFHEAFGPIVRADLPAAAVWLEALYAAAEARSMLHLFDAQEPIQVLAERLIGQLESDLPVGGGLNLVGAREHFEAAIVLAPDYLETRVLFALHWADRAHEPAIYRRLLDEVLAAPDRGDLPENAAAIATARALVAR
jgi:hypothetical protein